MDQIFETESASQYTIRNTKKIGQIYHCGKVSNKLKYAIEYQIYIFSTNDVDTDLPLEPTEDLNSIYKGIFISNKYVKNLENLPTQTKVN